MNLLLNEEQKALWEKARTAGVNAVAVAKSTNLGDDIQTEAARRFFKAERLVPRDRIDDWGDESTCVALCGWWRFGVLPKKARVVVIGTHLAPELIAQMDALEGAWDQLKEWVRTQGFPAGARDTHTLKALLDRGIEAQFSGCVTQTLTPVDAGDVRRDGRRLAVDIEPPGRGWQHVTHWREYLAGLTPQQRLEHASEQLSLFGRAAFVRTTRLHCALPAAALGVPDVRLVYTPRSVGAPERLSGFLPAEVQKKAPLRLLEGNPAAKKGASWVLVGNGPSVLREKRGEKIDAYDEVVRFNRYKIDGYAEHTGQRTTLWAYCGKGMAPLDENQRPSRGLCVHGAPAWRPEHLWRIPRDFYDTKRAEIQRRSLKPDKEPLLPSCGFLTACWLLDSGTAASVTLAGFDHFSRKQSGLHHYWINRNYAEPREHDGAVEKDILAEYAREGRLNYLA